MRRALAIFTAAAFALAMLSMAHSALADEPATQPTEHDTAPLLQGEPAPFDGVLLSEKRLVYFLDLRVQLTEAELKVQARDRALTTLEGDLAKAKTSTWWQRNGFWFGVGTGVVVTALVVWGTANALDAVK